MKTKILGLLFLMGVAGCGSMDEYTCIDGQLYRSWGGAWVIQEGKNFSGRAPGPIKCAEKKP
jgi:hypothetical protein